MAILSLRPKAFRTRNPGRDAETDQVRIETVSNAITMALADARRERDGLQQRLELYDARAATMLDNAASYGRRSEKDEAEISSAEQNAASARARIVQLDAQIERFGTLLAELQSQPTPAVGSGVA